MVQCRGKVVSPRWRYTGGAEIQLHSFLALVLDGNEWSTLHVERIFPRKTTRFSLKRRLSVPKGQSGQFPEREKYPTPAGIRNPDLPDHNKVTRGTNSMQQLWFIIIIVASSWYLSSFSYMMHGHTYIIIKSLYWLRDNNHKEKIYPYFIREKL